MNEPNLLDYIPAMDETTKARGRALAAWVAARGGNAAVLAMVYERDTKEFRSRSARLSQCIKDGFRERAALVWEEAFKPLGMPPGYLVTPTTGVQADQAQVQKEAAAITEAVKAADFSQLARQLAVELDTITDPRKKTEAFSAAVKAIWATIG